MMQEQNADDEGHALQPQHPGQDPGPFKTLMEKELNAVDARRTKLRQEIADALGDEETSEKVELLRRFLDTS